MLIKSDFAVPHGLLCYYGFDLDCLNIGQNLALNLAPNGGVKNANLYNFTNASIVSGAVDQALKFNGSTQYVDITPSQTWGYLDQFSLSFWLPDKGTNKTAYLFDCAPNSDTWGPLGVVYQGGGLKFCQGAGYIVVLSAWADLRNGDHICGVFNWPDWVFYRNGVRLNSGTSGTHFYASGGQPGYTSVIGRAGSYNNYYFDGVMDDVRVYNRPLHIVEVLTLYQAGLKRTRYSWFNELEEMFSPVRAPIIGKQVEAGQKFRLDSFTIRESRTS